MEELFSYLKNQFPSAEIFPSLDKDFICVREVIGQSNFGKNDKAAVKNDRGELIVPITNTEKYHVDTIRLKMISK